MPDNFSKVIVPEINDIEHQLDWAIGGLVKNWAGCESLFLAMFRTLHDEKQNDSTIVTWLSITSNRARMELLLRSVYMSRVSTDIIDEIEHLAQRFKAITKTRNFYCHAYYPNDPLTLQTRHIEGASLTGDRDVYSYTVKMVNKATINEIVHTINMAIDLRREAWPVLLALKDERKAHHVRLLEAPRGYPKNPRFRPPKHASGKQQKPPRSSHQ